MKKLSILILSHNRPHLFDRCLDSVMEAIPRWAEVIVNNDSRDIRELAHPQIEYHYKQFEHLSENYEYILSKANGEYIYFLEDDDYLDENFFKNIDMYLKHYDLIGGNYYPTWNDEWVIKCSTSMNKSFELNDDVFQLGQFIMRRSIAEKWEFPKDSHIHNDRKLVEYALDKSIMVINIPKILYFQTTDGGDNISFPESKAYNDPKN